MLLLTAVVVLAQTRPTDLFDACVVSLQRMKEYSVHIEAEISKAGLTKRDQFDVVVTGGGAYLRHREPKLGFLDRSDRRYIVRGDRLTGYDVIADERLQRSIKEGKTPAEKLASEFASDELSLSIALVPSAMRAFFGGFRAFRDWRGGHTSDTVTIERVQKGGFTQFRFAGSRHLLSEVSLKVNGSAIHWTYEFRPGGKIALDIPSDARRVLSFSQREAPPTYKTAQAKKIVERMLKAYAGLTHGTVDIKSDEGATHLILSGRQVRESNPRFEWAYDGVSLSMRNLRTRQFYRGKAKRPILSEYVTKEGGEVDPLVRPILAQRLPYLDLFPATGVVRLVGALGDKADIIEVKTSKLKISLFVRKDNGLLDSMESETVDRPGKIQSRTQRWFTYSRLGEKTDIETFRLLPGRAKVQPLPKLKILGETE